MLSNGLGTGHIGVGRDLLENAGKEIWRGKYVEDVPIHHHVRVRYQRPQHSESKFSSLPDTESLALTLWLVFLRP